jgi:prepilin-type processing-associated H-X9-DG protein
MTMHGALDWSRRVSRPGLPGIVGRVPSRGVPYGIACNARAYTLIEVLVIVVVLFLLAGILIPALTVTRQKKLREECVRQQKLIGLAFKVYPGNDDRYPYAQPNSLAFSNVTQVWLHFQEMSNELQTAKILSCPADLERRQNAALNFKLGAQADSSSLATKRNDAVSYFINLATDETRPQAPLAGDRHLAPDRKSAPYSVKTTGRAEIVRTGSEWSTVSPTDLHGGVGNMLLGDGSVGRFDNAQLQQQMRLATNSYGTNANRFLFPQ